MSAILEVRDLRKRYESRRGWFGGAGEPVIAVDDVSFAMEPGETFGLVGESGCGKSTVARCVAGLTPVTDGVIAFDGEDIATVSAERMRQLRRRLQIVFQDVTAALDSRMTVGEIVEEPLRVHRLYDRSERRRRAASTLERVGLGPAQLGRRPAALSGGQRQRVGLARAMVLDPELLILDEPVSAVDVSLQAQILNLLADLQRESRVSYLMIVHDLAVAEHICDRIAVLYLGRVVEIGEAASLFRSAQHPYTISLLSAAPIPDPAIERARKRIVLRGEIDRRQSVASGCVFRARCPVGADRELCAQQSPPLTDAGAGHAVACHFPGELRAS